MLNLTDTQIVFSWWKRSFHPPHALQVYIVFPYLFRTKMPPAGYKIARPSQISLPAGAHVFTFYIYFLIPITAGISGVFALKLGCVINCKTFPLSDRISLDSAIKERREVNALHSYNNFLHNFGNKNNYTTGRQSWADICQCWWCNEHHRWCWICLDMIALSFQLLPRLDTFKTEMHGNIFPQLLKHPIWLCKAKWNIFTRSWHVSSKVGMFFPWGRCTERK